MARLRNKPPAERLRCLDGSLENETAAGAPPARGQRLEAPSRARNASGLQ